MCCQIVRIEKGQIFLKSNSIAGEYDHIVLLSVDKGSFEHNALLAVTNKSPKEVPEAQLRDYFSRRRRVNLDGKEPQFYNEYGRPLCLRGCIRISRHRTFCIPEDTDIGILERAVRIRAIYTVEHGHAN